MRNYLKAGCVLFDPAAGTITAAPRVNATERISEVRAETPAALAYKSWALDEGIGPNRPLVVPSYRCVAARHCELSLRLQIQELANSRTAGLVAVEYDVIRNCQTDVVPLSRELRLSAFNRW
jgi:hypothetical protein